MRLWEVPGLSPNVDKNEKKTSTYLKKERKNRTSSTRRIIFLTFALHSDLETLIELLKKKFHLYRNQAKWGQSVPSNTYYLDFLACKIDSVIGISMIRELS